MSVAFQFPDKEIAPWSGMGLMKRLCDRIGVEAALRGCGLPEAGTHRGDASLPPITQLMLSVGCGANRFEHGEVTRHDPVLQRLFSFKRMANFKAVMRLFRKFSQARHEGVEIERQAIAVMTRYGTQVGVRRGDARTVNGAEASLDRLDDQRVVLVCADSGLGSQRFLESLETRRLHYMVAWSAHQPLQRALVAQTGWWSSDDGIELVGCDDQGLSSPHPRRVIGIRQYVERRETTKGKTRSLFADDPQPGAYRFAAHAAD